MLFIINNKYIEINRYDFINDKEYYSKLMELINSSNKNINNTINVNNKKKNTLENINNLINCK